MFQKFYTDTLGSRFIKSMLAQTPIPLFNCVTDNDYLIEGCYYVYKRFIIQCVSSGVLKVSEQENLVPSNTLFPSVFLFVGTGVHVATFYVRSYVDDVSVKTHSVFKSSTNYYDSETHYHLGRYLRYLRTVTGQNLFPFYNTYNSTYFTDIELHPLEAHEVKVSRTDSQNYKVVGVPIKFGRTYSIAIDCPTQVLFRACIHDDSGYISEDAINKENLKELSSDVKSLQETLNSSGKIYSRLRFDSPVKFRLETNSRYAMMFESNLYLVIQLPSNNNSSIVVLEDFNNTTGITCNNKNIREVNIINPSLLRMNTRSSYAFSDRLIEYLLGNVICENDYILGNVSEIQSILSKLFSDYNMSIIKGLHRKGIWDNDVPRFVQKLIETDSDILLYDQDGNVNRDAELLLYRTGGRLQ